MRDRVYLAFVFGAAFLLASVLVLAPPVRREPSPESVTLRCTDLCRRSDAVLVEVEYEVDAASSTTRYSCVCSTELPVDPE